VQSIRAQVLPPLAGAAALMRTVVVIDRVWFDWLSAQLAKLLSAQVRLIPDCLLLGLPQLGERVSGAHSALQPSLMYECIGPNVVWTFRFNALVGSSWIEQVDVVHQSSIELMRRLPTQLQHLEPSPYSWQWLIDGAQRFTQEGTLRSINLLPKSFRLMARPHDGEQSEDALGNWRDRILWQRPLRWLMYCMASLMVGFLMHLAWIAIADWRWTNKMQSVATPYLSEASSAALSSDQAYQSPLSAFTHQVTQDKRRSGFSGDADFSSLSKKLQQLNVLYGGRLVRSIHYNGYDMEFEIDPKMMNAKSFSAAQLIHQAIALDLAVTSIEGNRFRLSPYGGLGEN
jgi:hypothetical protein